MSRKRSSVNYSESAVSENCNGQWVMITQESNLQTKPDEDSKPLFCQLRHPKTGTSAVYMFTDACRHVEEVTAFNEGHRSWFIGNYVHSDGTLLITTPVDPLFLVLPYLIKASLSGKYQPIDCLLEDNDFPECKRLATCISSVELSHVTTVKGSDDMYAFKYDNDKTLAWLKFKVDNLVAALQKHQVNVGSNSTLSTYVKSTKTTVNICLESYMAYACGMIAEYLQPELAKQLRELLGVKTGPVNDAKENYSGHSPVKKKGKLTSVDSLTPLEDYSASGNSASNKPEKLSVAQKKLNKVDKTGMKSLSSFFSVAAKK